MSYKPLILIIEDDKAISNFISISLETQGYDHLETDQGSLGISLVFSHNPDIVLLDLGLPDMDGLEVLKKIRPYTKSTIIVISARGHEREKVDALDLGADDYITKPFSVPELLARIRVVLRHKENGNSTSEEVSNIFTYKDLKIEYLKHKITIRDKEIHLTPIEYNLLTLLAKNQGKVLTNKFIIGEIWGSYALNDVQSLRVFMATLRRKIEDNPGAPNYIFTKIGVGYQFADE